MRVCASIFPQTPEVQRRMFDAFETGDPLSLSVYIVSFSSVAADFRVVSFLLLGFASLSFIRSFNSCHVHNSPLTSST